LNLFIFTDFLLLLSLALPGISQEDSLQYFHDEITVNWYFYLKIKKTAIFEN